VLLEAAVDELRVVRDRVAVAAQQSRERHRRGSPEAAQILDPRTWARAVRLEGRVDLRVRRHGREQVVADERQPVDLVDE
jgi:hypothetical protein